MTARIVVAAACALLSVGLSSSVLADEGHAETVAPKFNQAIPNVAGKSLVVDTGDKALTTPDTRK